MNNEKMEPCPNPWCSPNNKRTKRSKPIGLQDYLFWIRCACGVCSPPKRSESEAIVAWNTRPDPQREVMRSALETIRDQGLDERQWMDDLIRAALEGK